jgi:DNA-binding response OmpR family regulator
LQEITTVPKDTLLIVEDAPDIQMLLNIYFSSQGYDVHVAGRGSDALDLVRKKIPNLVLLDVNLPDMLGYDIGKAIRANTRTRHIPIIFLTARTEKQDIMVGLGEVEAEAYIAKPFDIELLHLEVRNTLKRARQKNQTHPVTNLPTADAVNEQLRNLLQRQGWTLSLMRIEQFETFTQSYGAVSGEEVLKFMALMLNDTVGELGESQDFIGQLATGPEFVLISTPETSRTIAQRLTERFDAEISLHYNYRDRKNGAMRIVDAAGNEQHVPLMSLAIGMQDDTHGPFYDIRELTESVEAVRQNARSLSSSTGKSALIIA